MGSENAKVRVGIYIEKAILEQADGLLETANVRSRNEFVAESKMPRNLFPVHWNKILI